MIPSAIRAAIAIFMGPPPPPQGELKMPGPRRSGSQPAATCRWRPIAASVVPRTRAVERASQGFRYQMGYTDDEDLARELRLEAEDLMRPSRQQRNRPPAAGPWLFADHS
jgi:hypothetical protein